MAFVLALSVLALLAIASPPPLAAALNTTHILGKYDNLSTFNKYLSETGVVKEIDSRASLTVLVPPNSALDPLISSVGSTNLLLIADILRYHCLLQYLDLPEIRSMTNSSGVLLTTLYQTTGRAPGQLGFLNLTVSPTGSAHLGLPVPGAAPNSTIVTNITQFPYNVSYMQIDHVLMPLGLGVSQGAAPGVANVTSTLKSKGDFTTLLGLLSSTGVETALKGMSAVTMLAPTDEAFKALSPKVLDDLTQAQKISLLQYHALPTYFTFGSLQSVTTPLPTVASGSSGKFALNVSSSGKTVTFVTGLNKANIVSTVLDQPPVAVYAVDKVLLPPEIFAAGGAATAPGAAPGSAPELAPSPGVLAPAPAATPEISPAPAPEISSPAPAPAPVSSSEAPAPSPSLSASPPAPPTGAATTPSASEASASAPGAPESSSSSSLQCGLLALLLSAAAAAASSIVFS